MTNCTQKRLYFPAVEFTPQKRKKVVAEPGGGDITTDGGVLLLREADRHLGLMKAVNKVLVDPRCGGKVRHSQLSMLQQRVYGLCLGYEDLNDHIKLREDPAIWAAVDREEVLASDSSLGRFERRFDRTDAVRIHEVFVDQFIASFKRPPKKLILDFDATDDRVHGQQEGRFFHGYYDHYCFLPLYVFCRSQLLVSYLRPSKIDGAKHSWAILSLLVKRLRQEWPKVRIIFRGDSGFCRRHMLRWCERNGVYYIVGIARNSRLEAEIGDLVYWAEQRFNKTQQKIRWFEDLQYAAKSWGRSRRVIAKIEYTEKGSNSRFIVTNLGGDAGTLYDEQYCARGDMENRIKEQQLGLFADRTSSHYWWTNQCRLLLSSLAYVLMDGIRRIGLKGTRLSSAQMTTIRLKLLKVGAIVLSNTRRIRFLLTAHFGAAYVFARAVERLKPG